MKTNIKIGIALGIALLLIACGSGTAVPKKRPINYRTPSAPVSVSPNPSKTVVITTTKPQAPTTRSTRRR